MYVNLLELAKNLHKLEKNKCNIVLEWGMSKQVSKQVSKCIDDDDDASKIK